MEYHCGTCGEKLEGDLLLYIDHTEKHIMDAIREKHPEWIEKDGICKKCYDHYKIQMKGDV